MKTRMFARTILVALVLLALTIMPATADELVPAGPIKVPTTVWYTTDPSNGAEFVIRSNVDYDMFTFVELWVFEPPYPDPWTGNPVLVYSANFWLHAGETVRVILDDWTDLPSPGEYWVPAGNWCIPGPSGLAGTDPFYWSGSGRQIPRFRVERPRSESTRIVQFTVRPRALEIQRPE